MEEQPLENNPELDGKYLGTITKDFVVVADTLKEAAYQLKVREISDHPIFVFCKDELQIGKLLMGKTEVALDWNIYFSFAEEFIQRGIIGEDRLEDFKATFKDPTEFCCVFVIDQDFVRFIFLPYPEDTAI